MTVNIREVNAIREAARAVTALVEAARLRGPLSDLPRKQVGHVGRTGKWLLRAIGNLIHDDPRLRGLLAEYAVEPLPTDADLDRIASDREEARKES